MQIAQAQLRVREATGNNDGIAVENYLHYTGHVKGDPWCAAFVSWVYGQSGYKFPSTAWSPALFPASRRVDNPQPADVFGIYFSSLKRIAHCGLVKSQRGSWLITIEGNTNMTGSREGDGVYTKYRHKRTIMYYADWLKGGGI
ncbi:peptidoglycan-binding protein [Pedobacter sp. BMA]|nr:peptidoglycan-binding protein [Pedobacter sp. BMA]